MSGAGEGGGPPDDGGFVGHSPLPQLIGSYQVLARLGGGSMADLHLTNKTSPYGVVGRAIIKRVKRSRTDFKELQSMLLDEARATACFDHPNLVAILDVGEDQSGVYLALEYVEGTDLRRVNSKLRGRREALPFELAAFIVGEVLRGLHHAHTSRGPDGQPLEIVHRDVNPANILISTTGHVKLADFGVVRMRDRIQAKTEPGLVKGKYAYLAPEYIAGEPCSVQTDIYAAGIMLFELLSGRECFSGKTAYEVMWKIVNQGVPMYRLEREGVQDDLKNIVERATSTAPERRYSTAQDMANALEAWLMRSGRHATPWVLSVFFTRHRLYPDTTDILRQTQAPLANAIQALGEQKKMLPPPRAPEPRLDTGQVVAHQLEPATAAREIESSSLTPMPNIEPAFDAVPILAPELTEAATDTAAPVGIPDVPPIVPDVLNPPTLGKTPVMDVEVSEPTPTPNVFSTPTGDVVVERREMGDTAWVEFSSEREETAAEGPGLRDPHNHPTLPSFEAVRPDQGQVVEFFEPPPPAPEPAPEPEVDPNAQTAPPSMQASADLPLSGKLEDTPGVDVLETLTDAGRSGTLEFRCGLIWKRVQICEGAPMGITSNMGMELIGEHLVKSRLITRRDLDNALAAAERTGTLMTVKMLELGLLSKEILEEELGNNLGARLAEVLEWRWGTYEYRDEQIPRSELVPRMDLAGLIQRARDTLDQRVEDEEKKESSGSVPTPQKRLKDALKAARSIASNTGKGRVERVDPITPKG